jgi:hypothetical protein
MQDVHRPASPAHPVWLILTHAVSAMVIGLCAALPATGATVLIALGASCISIRGCQTPTVVDALVPIVAITVWTATTLIVGARHIRAALSTAPTPPIPQHHAPRSIHR